MRLRSGENTKGKAHQHLVVSPYTNKHHVITVYENDTGMILLLKAFKTMGIEDTICHREGFYIVTSCVKIDLDKSLRHQIHFDSLRTSRLFMRMRPCPVPYDLCTCTVGSKQWGCPECGGYKEPIIQPTLTSIND